MTPLNGSSLGLRGGSLRWHPGRFSNAHPFDVSGSANPVIQFHCVHPFHLLSEHCSLLLSEG